MLTNRIITTMNHLSKRTIGLAAASILLSFFVGIGLYRNSKQATGIHRSFAEVPNKSSKIAIEGSLVSGFPEIPTYPGSTVENSYKKTVDDKTGYEAVWVTDATVAQVMNFFIQELPKTGWTIEGTPVFTQDTMEIPITIHKGMQQVNLNIEEDEEGGSGVEIIAEVPLQ